MTRHSIRTADPFHCIRFHHKRPPRFMHGPEIPAILYNRVLDVDMPDLVGLQRARRPVHLPNVLSRRDVVALLESGTDIRTIQTLLGHRDVVNPIDR